MFQSRIVFRVNEVFFQLYISWHQVSALEGGKRFDVKWAVFIDVWIERIQKTQTIMMVIYIYIFTEIEMAFF